MPTTQAAPTAILVARPGALRDAWRALLTALPHIRDIEQVEDAPAALQAVARLRPALVVVDATLLKGETEALLSRVKALSPGTRRLALAGSLEQKQTLVRSAAEAVLLPGAPAFEVADAIEQLLAGWAAH